MQSVDCTFQGNRNPFIDFPKWVYCVFQSECHCSEIGDCEILADISGEFSDCIEGPGTDIVEACSCPDVDDDRDVDIIDFAIFPVSITCCRK